jgi:hypothetical protein
VNYENKKSHFTGIESKTLLISLIILVVNLSVRGWFNVHTAMSRDEPYTLYFAQLPIKQLITIVLESNNPPTFEVLLHFWSQLVGNTERALRWLPTIIISLGAIPFSLIGKRIGGYPAMWFSSILFLGSGALMNFSHLDRAYCLLITGAIFQIYFLIKEYESPSWKNSVGWTMCTTILCYSHYFGWCMLVLIWLIIVALPIKSSTWIRRMIFATSFTFLFSLPIVFYLVVQMSGAATENALEISTPNVLNLVQLGTDFLNSRLSFLLLVFAGTAMVILNLKTVKNYVVISVLIMSCTLIVSSFFSDVIRQDEINVVLFTLLIAAMLVIIIELRRMPCSPPDKAIFHWNLLPIGIFFLVSARFPVFIDRYLSFVIPSMLMLVVVLFSRIPFLWARYTFASFFLILFIVGFRLTPSYNIDNRKAIEQFKNYHASAEVGIIGPGYHDLDFAYYFNRALFYRGAAHHSDTSGAKLISDRGFARHKEGIRRELLANRIIVSHDSSDLSLGDAKSVAYYDGNTSLSYPQNGIYQYLRERFGEPKESKSFEGVYRVYLFNRN